LAYFDAVRNTEAWYNNPVFSMVVHFTSTLVNILRDGRCSTEREISSSNVKGVLMADVTATGLWCYCPYHKNHFFSSKMWVPNWEFFGTGQKFHPSSTLS
jgi:hypothetical protein